MSWKHALGSILLTVVVWIAYALPVDAQSTTQGLYFDAWGNFGGVTQMTMVGTTGYYLITTETAHAPDARKPVKRTLKLKSYNKKTGRLVIDAFLRGKKIGTLDGIYTSEKVKDADGDPMESLQYTGTFTNVNGAQIPFSLHAD